MFMQARQYIDHMEIMPHSGRAFSQLLLDVLSGQWLLLLQHNLLSPQWGALC